MNVVYLNPGAKLGGAERSLLDVLAVVRQSFPEYRLHLIVGSAGPLLDRAAALGAQPHLVPMPGELVQLGDSALTFQDGSRSAQAGNLAVRAVAAGWRISGYLGQLRQALRQLRPKLIHSNGFKCHALTGRFLGLMVPVVWHVRDFVSPRPMMRRALPHLVNRRVRVIANSDAVAADVREVLLRTPVTRIYNAIDTDLFSPGPASPATLDSLAGLPPASGPTIRVGLVATYARWKGQDVFIDAAAKMLSTHQSFPLRFYIVGGPVYQTEGSQFRLTELQERLAKYPNLTGALGLIPFQEDLAPIYRSLDIVVHASTRPEPFGRTIVEAMACGRVVLAPKQGGAKELFQDGTDALGIDIVSMEGIAGAIARLAGDPAMRERMGREARKSAVEKFSLPRLRHDLAKFYQPLLCQRSAR